MVAVIENKEAHFQKVVKFSSILTPKNDSCSSSSFFFVNDKTVWVSKPEPHLVFEQVSGGGHQNKCWFHSPPL